MNNLLLILFVIFTSTLASPGDTSVEIPSGFDASSLPADFNASSLPNGFNASSIPPDVVANATKAYIQNFVSGLGNATRSLLPGGDNGMLFLTAALLLATTTTTAITTTRRSTTPIITSSNNTETDPCAVLIQKQNQTISDVTRCYDSFPYNADLAKQTLRAINHLVEAYAFADLMNNSPDPSFQPNIDIRGKLSNLSSIPFSTDRQFHQALAAVFTPLNDGHTAYVNYCYAQYAFTQPFSLISDFSTIPTSTSNSKPRILIQSYDSTLPFSKDLKLMNYVGAEVISIDGVPALEALQAYADSHYGSSKDPGTRLTQTLSSLAWDSLKSTFIINRGVFNARSLLPENDFIVYELRMPSDGNITTKISIPWSVKNLNPQASYKDSKSYWKEVCLPFSANTDQMEASTLVPIQQRLQQLPIFELKPFERVSPAALRKNPRDSNEDENTTKFPKPIITGPKFAFFFVQNDVRNLGILKMTSFDAPTPRWSDAMVKGFAALKQKGAEKIIFDFSDNGGGVICSAYALLKLLSPGKVQPFKTDIRLGGKLNEVAAKASQNNIFHQSHWLNENGEKFKSPTGLIEPRRYKKLSENNSTTPYTNLFLDQCKFDWPGDVKKIIPWDLKDLIFLTNGMCGSSCALVQNHIKEQTPEVRSVVVTAAPTNVQVTASTLPGGMVYRASYLASDIADSKMTSQMDVNFPIAAEFFFAFREAYSRKRPELVLEYLKTPADIRVNLNPDNILDAEKLWLDAAKAAWDTPKAKLA